MPSSPIESEGERIFSASSLLTIPTIQWKMSRGPFITCDQRKDNNFRVFTTNYNVICSKIYGDRCKQTAVIKAMIIQE